MVFSAHEDDLGRVDLIAIGVDVVKMRTGDMGKVFQFVTDQAGLFLRFSDGTFFEGLTEFHRTAGISPVMIIRALLKKQLVFLVDDQDPCTRHDQRLMAKFFSKIHDIAHDDSPIYVLIFDSSIISLLFKIHIKFKNMEYNSRMKKILVVEDEPDIRELLCTYLRNEGYDIAWAEDGVAAIALFAKDRFDLVLLDIMIPKIDGYGVCEVIKKQSDVPVLMLSALGDENSLIKGYDSLADDYVTKPFSMPVLLRKISAILRRENASSEKSDGQIISCGELTLLPDKMEVRVGEKKVEVTSREFDILLTLAKHPGRVYTREMLLELLWDFDSIVDERIVDSHIKNIRHKLGGDYIETVRGRGYKIDK